MTAGSTQSSTVNLDPDHILPVDICAEFQAVLQKFDSVFDPFITGIIVPQAPSKPLSIWALSNPLSVWVAYPQYSRNKRIEFQNKLDELERQGVFRRPEDIGITIENLNPSFLVTKPSGGHRLVTAFADVANTANPNHR